MSWANVGIAGAGLVGGMLGGGGGMDPNAARIANSKDAFVGGGEYRVGGPFDMRGRLGFVDGEARMSGSLGAFNPIAKDLLQNANFGEGGINMSFLQNIMRGAQGDMQAPKIQNFQNQQGMSGLSQMFRSSMGTANADPFQLGAGVTQNLRDQALPGQQRAVNSALSSLFSKGRLGTTGGANQMGALAEAQDQQDLGFQLAGLDAGRGLQSDAVARMFGANQGMEGIGGRRFNEQFSEAGLGGQMAMNRFGMGSSMADMLLQNLVQGNSMGMQNLSGAIGLSQLPLAFQNHMLNASMARSNAQLSRAGIFAGAPPEGNPLLSGLEAAGGLASFFNRDE